MIKFIYNFNNYILIYLICSKFGLEKGRCEYKDCKLFIGLMPDIFYFFFLVQINCCKKLMLRKMETKERTSIVSMNPVSLSLRVFRYFFRKLN